MDENNSDQNNYGPFLSPHQDPIPSQPHVEPSPPAAKSLSGSWAAPIPNPEPAPIQPPPSSPINDFHPADGSPNVPFNQTAQPDPGASIFSPSSTAPRRSHKKRTALILVILLSLLSTGSAFAYKSYYVDALTAPRDLFTGSMGDKSGKFDLTATINLGSSSLGLGSELSRVIISSSGSYDSTNPKNPKFDINLNGSLGVSKVAGEILAADNSIFLKITRFDLLTALGIKLDDSWYKGSEINSVAPDTKDCDYSAIKNPSNNILDQLTARDVPIKNASRVGLFEQIAGHQTTHYKGELDNAKLTTYIADVNKKLSADCQINLNYDEYKDLLVTYDVWTSSDFDRFKANFYDTQQKTSVDLTLDLSDFNKPVTITAPTNAKDINTLFPVGSLFSSPSPSSVPSF